MADCATSIVSAPPGGSRAHVRCLVGPVLTPPPLRRSNRSAVFACALWPGGLSRVTLGFAGCCSFHASSEPLTAQRTRNPIARAASSCNEYAGSCSDLKSSPATSRLRVQTHVRARAPARAKTPCKSYGPGRDRTCDLGIKSPAKRGAASCGRLKGAANTPVVDCEKLQRIEPAGGQRLRAPYAHPSPTEATPVQSRYGRIAAILSCGAGRPERELD